MSTLPVTSAGRLSWAVPLPMPWGEAGRQGCWEGAGGPRSQSGLHRGGERVAAAPGILLKAFSLFPAIRSAPPGPGHVDNLFVEGKGAKSEKQRGKCHYLLRQFLQPELGCWAALVGVHHTHPAC